MQGTVRERVTTAFDTLSPKQKKLARFILNSRYFIAFATAEEAGGKVGASAATVVRFAQALGYAGFSDLQAAIQTELPDYLTAVERIQARLSAPPVADDIPHQVFYSDINNIQRTARKVLRTDLEAVVNEIRDAERILIIGSGLSASPALFLAHSLKILGFDTRACIHEGLSLAADTAQLDGSWLLIAIDLWRYVRSTVEAVALAQENGARTIAITDNEFSPIVKIAHYALDVVTEGVAHSRSLTAVMALLNVIIAALSYGSPEQAIQALSRVDAIYRRNNLLIVE